MSEANSEDGLRSHRTILNMIECPRHHFAFRIGTKNSVSFSLQRRNPPESHRPFNSKKIPRKTNQVWKSDEGEGGNAEALRGVGGMTGVPTESERKIRFRVTTHAERANHSGFCPKWVRAKLIKEHNKN